MQTWRRSTASAPQSCSIAHLMRFPDGSQAGHFNTCGRAYVHVSPEYLWKMFPFMSLHQATEALRELREGGLIAERAEDIRLMAVTDPRTPVEAKEALDAFKRSSKPKRTGKPNAVEVEDVTEMSETIDMAEDENQADW